MIANRPDLIISDIKSPVMNGLDFLKWIKANPVFASIPVIILTGFSTIANANEAKRLGAADFISKPKDIVDLLARIRRVLGEK